MSLPGIGKELVWGVQAGVKSPYIMDVVLMIPLETRAVRPLYDRTHRRVCQHE